MDTVVVTETGTTYIFRGGRVNRNGVHSATFTVYDMKVAKHADVSNVPWLAPEEWETNYTPRVGRRMFVAGKDEWWTSSNVVSVTYVPYEVA